MCERSSLRILGFNLRVDLHKSATEWTRERREQFLLLPDVRSPVSADRFVWRRCNDRALFSKLFRHASTYPDTPLNGLKIYDLIDVDEAHSIMGSQTSCLLISIHAHSNVWEEIIRDKYIDPPVDISTIDDRIVAFGGFDVCDDWLLSGMMNCVTTDESLRRKRHRFS